MKGIESRLPTSVPGKSRCLAVDFYRLVPARSPAHPALSPPMPCNGKESGAQQAASFPEVLSSPPCPLTKTLETSNSKACVCIGKSQRNSWGPQARPCQPNSTPLQSLGPNEKGPKRPSRAARARDKRQMLLQRILVSPGAAMPRLLPSSESGTFFGLCLIDCTLLGIRLGSSYKGLGEGS